MPRCRIMLRHAAAAAIDAAMLPLHADYAMILFSPLPYAMPLCLLLTTLMLLPLIAAAAAGHFRYADISVDFSITRGMMPAAAAADAAFIDIIFSVFRCHVMPLPPLRHATLSPIRRQLMLRQCY